MKRANSKFQKILAITLTAILLSLVLLFLTTTESETYVYVLANPQNDNSQSSIQKISCARTFTFRTDSVNGMCSSVNLLTNYFAYGTENKYNLLLDDSDFNYGRFSDFFDLSNLLAKCSIPHIPHYRKRVALLRNMTLWKNEKNLNIDRKFFRLFNQTWIYQKDHQVPNRTGIEKYRPIFDKRYEIIKRFWVLNKDLQAIFDLKLKDLNNLVGEGNNRKFLSVYMRFGDKLKEVVNRGRADSIPDIDKYLGAMDEIIQQNGFSKPVVLVTSDDASIPRQVQRMRPDWIVYQPFPKTSRLGHFQAEFNAKSQKERIQDGLEMVIELSLHAQSEYVVCTNLSNLCRVIGLLRGPKMIEKFKSIFLDWVPH
eukprot:TRINITY_DN5561_c0_g1_i1.p1 TRINITY_DN5561_c0_g1~~TRINITY_DN5561_c0_g1_i1.p1  ORF type:complete len:368 (-),score=63.36 TRINITY_DN5561_c0_g1_i1:118-1221(-)